MKESDVQKQIVDYLRQTGWVVMENSQKSFDWGTPGRPDVVAVKKAILDSNEIVVGGRRVKLHTEYPRHLHIEVKGSRGVQSDNQIEMQRRLEEQGAEYLLANSLDVVMDYLKG